MKEVFTLEEFKRVLKSHRVVILDVFATWCSPCKKVAPVFEELSLKFGGTMFLKTNCADDQEIAHHYEIASVPTFVAFVNGEEEERLSGGNPDKLRAFVTKYAKE
jgi:thioredoxin